MRSFKLAKLGVVHKKEQLIDGWLADRKLECSEELGEHLYQLGPDLALRIYAKGRVNGKVVTAFAVRGEVDNIAAVAPALVVARNDTPATPQGYPPGAKAPDLPSRRNYNPARFVDLVGCLLLVLDLLTAACKLFCRR